jgi:hypothetical protein
VKKLLGLILLLLVLTSSLPVAACSDFGTKIPPGYQIEEYYRQLKVDVSTTTGRLLKNWDLFIKTNYKGWKVEQQPLVDEYGRYFVVLGRWSIRLIPIVIDFSKFCEGIPGIQRPPSCPDVQG